MATQEDIDTWFVYHPPTPSQVDVYQRIRNAGYEMAETVLNEAPEGPDTEKAFEKIREAVMWANAAIACSPVQITEDEVLPEGVCDKDLPHEGHEDERDGLKFWCTGGQGVTMERPEDREPEDEFATDFGGDPNEG